MNSWDDVKGVGPARRSAFEQAGLFSPQELAERLPVGYRDSTRPQPVVALREGMETAFWATAENPRIVRAQGKVYVAAKLKDATGSIKGVWFSAPWMRENLSGNHPRLFWGRVLKMKSGGLTVVNPMILEKAEIQPVYRPLDKVPPKLVRTLIEDVLESCRFEDALPEAFRSRYGLSPRQAALKEAHFPTSSESLLSARRRLAFEDLSLFQVQLQSLRHPDEQSVQIASSPEDTDTFWSLFPFAPTGAQRRVLEDIRKDLAASRAMARLVQGDVGCGKTAIALGALYLTVKAGYQGVMMAPTEVLAIQHYQTLQRLLSPLGISCVLLTGRLTAAARRQARQAAASGEAQIIVGTHALLSEGVEYLNLGLAVTDEQHRFGVRQRSLLSQKTLGDTPNVLVMSATPIPRTLSLILYGDLDVSIVDELPSGRKPVMTRVVPESKRDGLYQFLRDQISQGRQAYIVCPLVDESETMDCSSAQETWESLRKGPLSDLRLGLVHGRMKGAEKENQLAAFRAGELDILVSTTVIEVGVDVPNATVMVIENADRFGLSQLHQLRGRVGRGAHESYCFLMGDKNERLQTMVRTCDGFEIAQQDLQQRGPGEWFGTRQHGAPEMPGASLCSDVRLLEETHRAVQLLLLDPERTEEAERMRQAARRRFGDALDQVGLN